MGHPQLFLFYFRLFKHYKFYNEWKWKMSIQYGAGIRTHDLQNMSLLSFLCQRSSLVSPMQ